MARNDHPELAGDPGEFLNALRAYLGMKPLCQDGRSLEPGHDHGEGRSDVGLRWMVDLNFDLRVALGGRVRAHPHDL